MGNIGKGFAVVSETISSATNSVGDLVSSKRQFISKQIINAILLLMILLIFGCFDFLHLKFHYEYLADYNYWVNITIKSVADICAYNIGVNFIIDDIITRNTVLQELKTQYEKLNAVKQEDFPVFIDKYNREQKIISWKNYVNHKIYLLNKFSKQRDRIHYNGKPPFDNKYAAKRYELEQMKTDEFIMKNIDNLEVSYKDIDTSIFELEINGTEKVVQNKVTGSVSKGRAIASISTMIGILGFSVIVTPIGLEPNKEEFDSQMVAAVNTVVRMAQDIGIIVWQFLRGIIGTPKIVSVQMTIPLAERVKILKLYYAWRRANNKEVPQCYLDTLNEKQEEYIEMTEEEYKKRKGE